MTRQSRHAQECVTKTDILSNEIQEVSRVVEQVEKLVDEMEGGTLPLGEMMKRFEEGRKLSVSLYHMAQKLYKFN